MDRLKQIETVRKRNAELTKQLDNARFELEYNSQLNMKGYQCAKNLIAELEQIQREWMAALDDLNDKREKYSVLIAELQEIKKIMISTGFRIPWYKKIINKFKRV